MNLKETFIKMVKRVLFAFTAAYIALLPQFYTIYNPETRLTLLWNHSYHAAILTAIFLLGTFYFTLFWLIIRCWKKSARLHALIEFLMFWILIVLMFRTTVSIMGNAGFLNEGPLSMLDAAWAKLIYYVALPVLFLWRGGYRATRIIRRIYALLAPLVLMVALWPLTYKNYERDMPLPDFGKESRGAARVAPGPNIYIFMFDEWSYPRTFPGGKVWEELPHLKSLLETSTLYTQAYSPGSRTGTSILRFLYQPDPTFQKLDYKQVMAVNYEKEPPYTNIFSEAGSEWYKLATGFWIDYPGLLGRSVDFGLAAQNEAAWRSYGREVNWLLRSQLSWLRHLGVGFKVVQDPPSVLWIYSQEQIHRMSLKLILEMHSPTFAFFHYCLPHYPFVWNREGKRNPLPQDIDKNTWDNYADNMRYMDTVIGELENALRSSDKWNSSLLILTSDHTWRMDPKESTYDEIAEDAVPQSRIKHVPLIIRWPGQKEAVVHNDPISTAELYPLIRKTLASVQAPK